MSKRRKLIVGNWKMNGRLTSGLNLARDIAERCEDVTPLPFDIAVCPPSTLIWPICEATLGTPVLVGGQDCHFANHGAYTGDISAGMLADLGARYVILGHSERRTTYGETGELIAKKAAAAQLAGLTTIICVGESLEQKASGETEAAITEQIETSLPENAHSDQLVIAYEPIWAIGSGEIPDIDYIRTVHQLIRENLGTAGDSTQILYGGSVKPDNADEILNNADVDGALVGGASLNVNDFWGIAEKVR